MNVSPSVPEFKLRTMTSGTVCAPASGARPASRGRRSRVARSPRREDSGGEAKRQERRGNANAVMADARRLVTSGPSIACQAPFLTSPTAAAIVHPLAPRRNMRPSNFNEKHRTQGTRQSEPYPSQDPKTTHCRGSDVPGTLRRRDREVCRTVGCRCGSYGSAMSEAIALDTHCFVKRLTDCGFTEKQAKTLAEEHVRPALGSPPVAPTTASGLMRSRERCGRQSRRR